MSRTLPIITAAGLLAVSATGLIFAQARPPSGGGAPQRQSDFTSPAAASHPQKPIAKRFSPPSLSGPLLDSTPLCRSMT